MKLGTFEIIWIAP